MHLSLLLSHYVVIKIQSRTYSEGIFEEKLSVEKIFKKVQNVQKLLQILQLIYHQQVTSKYFTHHINNQFVTNVD